MQSAQTCRSIRAMLERVKRTSKKLDKLESTIVTVTISRRDSD